MLSHLVLTVIVVTNWSGKGEIVREGKILQILLDEHTRARSPNVQKILNTILLSIFAGNVVMDC